MADDDTGSQKKRKRNIALGLALAGCVVLFYIITVVKLGG